jgi:hypothetical protein
MEEEGGNQEICLSILLKGLKFNPYNEILFSKVVKIEEKKQNYSKIRDMVKFVQEESKQGIDHLWKILLEGALFEGRCGNREEARKQFRFLLKKCKNFSTVYLEASKYEERENKLE